MLPQVLPVNDTQVYHTFWDSYPYSAISVFALHPLYLSLQALVKGKVPAAVNGEIAEARMKSTSGDVDYTTTIADKLRIARMVFDSPQGRMCAPLIAMSLTFSLSIPRKLTQQFGFSPS